MPEVHGVASGRIVSAGATLVFGAGLALYELTSLVLGPVGSRQLDLSLSLPPVGLQDLSDPNASTNKLVVGARAIPAAPAFHAIPAAPAFHAIRAAASTRAASVPTSLASSHPLPLPVPSLVAGEGQGRGSHAAGKKHPVDD